MQQGTQGRNQRLLTKYFLKQRSRQRRHVYKQDALERALNRIQEKGNDAFYFRNHAVASATGTPREISSEQSLREPAEGGVMKSDNTQA